MIIDADVKLNVQPGRKLKNLKSLSLGKGARIRSGSVLYMNSKIGKSLETGHHVVIREENRIGDHVSIWNNTTVDYGCVIGNRVKVHCNCYIAQYSVLEDDVFIAPGTVLANDLYPMSKHSAKVLQGPLIRKGARIGVNCTILPGVVIGRGAIVGAGSVVTRSIPDGMVAWGNPARVERKNTDLVWPKDFKMTRGAAQRYYRTHVAGKRAY